MQSNRMKRQRDSFLMNLNKENYPSLILRDIQKEKITTKSLMFIISK